MPGLLGVALNQPSLFYTAVGTALVAALLNAIFDFCPGCAMYLLGQRLRWPSGEPATAVT